MKIRTTLVALLGLLLTGCGDSSPGVTAPDVASRNGSILGSGNLTQSEDGAPAASTTEAGGDSITARNGGILGSGN